MSWWKSTNRTSLTVICAVCTLAVVAACYTEPLRLAEFSARDRVVRYGSGARPEPALVYLAIDYSSTALELSDEAIAASPALSLMKETGWPWRRDVYALIFDRLIGAGARVVGLDLLFPTPRDGDEAFAAALEKHRDQVVLGSNFVDSDRLHGGATTLTLPSGTLLPQTEPPDDRIGFVNFWPDVDGIVRRVCYATTANEIEGLPPPATATVYESLAARILRKAGLADRVPAGTDRKLFRYIHPGKDRVQPLSIYEIFVADSWARPPWNNGELLRDKIVLIGPEGNLFKDELPTPFGKLSGPEIHLNALNAVLGQNFLSESSGALNLALVLAGGLVAWLLSLSLDRPFLRLGILLLAVAAYYGLAQVLYNRAGLFIDVVAPLLALSSSGGVWLVWEQVIQRRERARTRRTLERYMSRNLVQEILDNPATYFNSLGGVRKCIGILFTDLRGFTTLTEEADSQQLVSQLNEYFTEMVKHIFENKGTVDKFIGDAIMATWGIVVSDGPEEDVTLAVTAALRMRQGLKTLNQEWQTRGIRAWAMGMGIDYGEAIVGNIGAAGENEKMDLTVIGDTINFASRLEGLTKEYGVDLLIGETAAKHCAASFHLQLVDLVQVKGKTRPVSVYAVLGEAAEPLAPDTRQYLETFEQAMSEYRASRFEEAGKLFAECEKTRADDKIAPIFVKRCAQLQNSPPEAPWNGVFVMTKK